MKYGINVKFAGLTEAEVGERIARGEVNTVVRRTSRSYAEIIRSNVFTLFNAILGVALVFILIFGAIPDALFGLVLIANILIGVVQEVRAKITLDRLSLISAPKARVIRAGKKYEIPMSDIVLDDLMELQQGDQVGVDGAVLVSEGLSLDESLLTGESEPIIKSPEDTVLSGSFVVAGTGIIRATRVGVNAYINKLSAEARRFNPVHSELEDGINTILRFIAWVTVPAGILLIVAQLRVHLPASSAVVGATAGIIGMVPQGLVLLTSAAFAVSVIALGRRKVLVQQLPAVEVLARVDTLCIDKTGTITEGIITFDRIEPLDSPQEALQALGALTSETVYRNPTLAAIAAAVPSPKDWHAVNSVPFSSERKWSGMTFAEHGTWVLGAPEIILRKVADANSLFQRVTTLTESGSRVLLLSKSGAAFQGETLPGDLQPVALVILEEKIRDDAPSTLQYFKEQAVSIKVISGDNPATVAAITKRAGLQNIGTPVDAYNLPKNSEALVRLMDEHTVFGRVTPEQKRDMIQALKMGGHTVAMLGDGVNDVPAIKAADLGISMGSGAPATRSIAQIVLINGRFATLPDVVAEGRRVIANIERVSNLFITKTVYATIITIIVAIAGLSYPLLPRQLTLIDALTIGTPAFFLSFAPTKKRYIPGFIRRVLYFAIPAGLLAATAALISYLMARNYFMVNLTQARTLTTIVLVLYGFWVLAIIVRPFTIWRVILTLSLIVGFIIAFSTPLIRMFLMLSIPTWQMLLSLIAITILAIIALEIVRRGVQRKYVM